MRKDLTPGVTEVHVTSLGHFGDDVHFINPRFVQRVLHGLAQARKDLLHREAVWIAGL